MGEEGYTQLREDLREYQRQAREENGKLHGKIDSVLVAVQGVAADIGLINARMEAHQKANDRDIGELRDALTDDVMPKVDRHERLITRISGAGLIVGACAGIYAAWHLAVMLRGLF